MSDRKTLPRTVQIPDRPASSPAKKSAVVVVPAAPSETGRVVAGIPSTSERSTRIEVAEPPPAAAVSQSEVEGVEAVSDPVGDARRKTRAMGRLPKPRATPAAGTTVPETEPSLALDSYAMSLVRQTFHDDEILTPVVAANAPDPNAELPRRIGVYDIERRIGSGGMADVFLARRIGPAGLEKHVVLKCIHAHLAQEQAFVETFLDQP